MAQEGTYSLQLTFLKGGVGSTKGSGQVYFDVAGTNFVQGTGATTTAYAALPLGSITTPGMLIIRNLDTTNDIFVGPDGTVASSVRVKAGTWAMFYCGSTTPNVKSNAGTPKFEYLLIEA